MPVGRFVLDVHGESERFWPASDALCSALQIINHLQDCAKDYRNLDRVYIPLDALGAHGVDVKRWLHPSRRLSCARCLAVSRRPERAVTLKPTHPARAQEPASRPRRRPSSQTGRTSCSSDSRPRSFERAVHLRGKPLAGIAALAAGVALVPRHSATIVSAAPQGATRNESLQQTGRIGAALRRGARSTRPCAFCRGSSAKRCSRSTHSAAPSTTSPTRRSARRSASPRSSTWRRDIDDLYAGGSRTERCRRSSLRSRQEVRSRAADFLAVIDGMEMDVRRRHRAPDFVTLDLYCDRVASAVGRLSVRIFGVPETEGVPLAHHLGRALQLTNILRDLDEDAAIGRLYLPREALDAGIGEDLAKAVMADPELAAACALVAEKRAAISMRRAHYGRDVRAKPCARRA